MEGNGAAANLNDNKTEDREAEQHEEDRNESQNLGESGDEQLVDNDDELERPRKKKYHRHTQFQISELETFFKDCAHPDDKQRQDLSQLLGLETKQIKFWFQNRRTQMKTQLERHENIILRQDNEKLRAENHVLRETLADPTCSKCGGPVIPAPISNENQKLRMENARLKEELTRVCNLASKFLSQSAGRTPSSIPLPPKFDPASFAQRTGVYGTMMMPDSTTMFPSGLDLEAAAQPSSGGYDKSAVFVDFALGGMNELMKMVHLDEPLWLKGGVNDGEILNLEEYNARVAAPSVAMRRSGLAIEATRASAIVVISSSALVELLMEVGRWRETFAGLVGESFMIDVVSCGSGGTRDGTLQMMEAEFQVISPVVPTRQSKFLRLCKQQAEGIWAVVDVSLDANQEGSSSNPFPGCMRLPSGCFMEDMANGCCKVTWVEHWEYDESSISKQLLRSAGMSFGAKQWIATLQRYCERIAILMSPSPTLPENHSLITVAGKKSMVKLSERMVNIFCSGICGAGAGWGGSSSSSSTLRKWEKLMMPKVGEEVTILTRKNLCEPGEATGVVLSASTSVWLHVSRRRLFEFLRSEETRKEWDVLAYGGALSEMARIPTAHSHGNCVSLLRAAQGGSNPTMVEASHSLILQETWNDSTSSLLVYAPVDMSSMDLVMSGGDGTFVALLPSGFAILPDDNGDGDDDYDGGEGCVLTVGFQVLANTMPEAKLMVESVDTVNDLLITTVERIKEVFQLP